MQTRIATWDAYFLEMCRLASRKSKHPRAQVGCVIVGRGHEVLATGFNGIARGVEEHEERYERPLSGMFCLHAELNAILNAARRGVSLNDTTAYVMWYPCCFCAAALIQVGVRHIVVDGTTKYGEEIDERWADRHRAAETQLKEAGVYVTTVNAESLKSAGVER